MKRRFAGPLPLFVVVGIAGISIFVAACGAKSSSSGGGPTPTPAPTPLVGCKTGAESVAIAAESLTFGRRMPDMGPHAPYIPDRIAVRLATTADTTPEVNEAMARLRAIQVAPRGGSGYAVYSIPSGEDPQAAAAALAGTRGIVEARPLLARYLQGDPDDPNFGLASQLNSPQTNPASPVQWDMFVLNMPNTWATFVGSSNITIAIIDSGYDANNLDICQKVLGSAVFDLGSGAQDTKATAQDTDGHGSNVSGIAASSTNNLTRYAGVGWNTSLLEVRVFPNTPNPTTSDLDVAAGIGWAVAHGARVINLSLGGKGTCPSTEQNAINAALAANVTVVVASGNGDKASAGQGYPFLFSPANCAGVIAVGASALDDFTNPGSPPYPEVVAGYSNFGTGLTLVAPGGDPCVGRTEACTPTGPPSDFLQWITNNYSTTARQFPGHGVFIAGTSQATPHVSGVVSLMYAKNPAISPATVKSILSSQALGLDDICSCPGQGNGRLDAQKALSNT
jgi:serine protease